MLHHWCQQHIRTYHNVSVVIINSEVVVDTDDDASMDEFYVTYVDDEHVDNHDYDDNTDDDHDNNNDLYGRACNARVNTSIYIYIYKYKYL